MGQIVQHFLKEMTDEQELILHTKIMKHEKIEELEKCLQTGNPLKVRQYYQNLQNVVDNEVLTDLSGEIETTDTDLLTPDDMAVIEFITEHARKAKYKDFVSITGVLIHNMEISTELAENQKDIPRNVEVSALLWMYLNLYELILDTISKGLYTYYSREGIRENRGTDIRRRLDNGKHLMAGEIEDEFQALDVLDNRNQSIFSKDRSRFIRNKLGHANIFYDDEADSFTLTSGEQYSFHEFMKEYDILYQFLVEWLFQLNDDDANIENTLDEFLKQVSQRISREFLKIERGYRKEFNKLILDIKEGSN